MADGDIRKHDRKHDRPDAERGGALKKRVVRKGDERGAEELSDESLDQVSGGGKTSSTVDDTIETVEGVPLSRPPG